MPTANERKALWFLAFVAISGSAVRVWRANAKPPSAAEAAALTRQIGRVDSARQARGKRSSATRPKPAAGPQPIPPDTAAPIDLDRASVEEIERLPGIGPALARRIVASRDSNGTFGDIEALCQVKGVGPALAKKLGPLVTFTGSRRPVSDACGSASRKTPKTRVMRPRERR